MEEFIAISFLLITLSLTQLVSIVLLVILFILGFKVWEMNWSYKISKPFQWEEAVKQGAVSKKLLTLERTYRDKVRFYSFWFQIMRLKRDSVEGAFAELGVYQGETAEMISEMDPSRKLFLLDTFEGFSSRDLLVERDVEKNLTFSDTSLERVKQIFNGNENIYLIPGYFPDTAIMLPEQSYAFVHLDADLYHPTLEGLRYFYPRLSAGGVIIVHDYNHNWDGARKAVDEFLSLIRETPGFIADWQGSIMIIRNRLL